MKPCSRRHTPSPPTPLPQAGEGRPCLHRCPRVCHSQTCRRANRRGVLLAAVIICLAVASAVLLAVVKTAVTGSRALRTETWQVQAGWLAESGLERAADRLAADRTYAGETWRITAEDFGPTAATDVEAVVKIEVETVARQPERRLVRVQADYPDHPEHRARQSRAAIVQVPPEKTPPADAPADTPASELKPNTTEDES